MQAYKLLARQEGLSNNKAKKLIDDGLVSIEGKKVVIARAEVPETTRFSVKKVEKPKVIFEDEKIIAVDKPAFLTSGDIRFDNAELIHRLDKETTGVLLFSKDEDFRKRCVEAFKKQRVTKLYVAWVEGIFSEETVVDCPIKTVKKGMAISRCAKDGKPAKSIVRPLEIHGKKSKVEIEITTGRTHQIRVHLAHIGHPIIGDSQYGARYKANRVLLHAKYLKIFEYELSAKEPKDFKGFN